jgi:ribonuclease HI
MKRGADITAKPRSEQRKPRPEPEQEPEPQPQAPAEEAQEEEASEQANLMELQVVFDGGSRGNPGQGYGSFLVQAPGRKPVIKRLEFGDNYTNNQAEYDTLIGSLDYIIERLNTTGRTPDQVQLDIKTDSDLVVNQILGNFKVKDAGLRKRHEQATGLLSQFADWSISWHPRDESVKLLGH